MAVATTLLSNSSAVHGTFQSMNNVQLWTRDIDFSEVTVIGAGIYKVFTIPAGSTVIGAWAVPVTAFVNANAIAMVNLGDSTTPGIWSVASVDLKATTPSQSILTTPFTYATANELQISITSTTTLPTAGLLRVSMLIVDTKNAL